MPLGPNNIWIHMTATARNQFEDLHVVTQAEKFQRSHRPPIPIATHHTENLNHVSRKPLMQKVF